MTDGPGPAKPGDRPARAIFVVTALGAFMASLDLSIVNIAFPALARTFSHDSLGLALLGDYRVRRSRSARARDRRAHRRPARRAARLLHRARRLPRRRPLLCGVAPTLVSCSSPAACPGPRRRHAAVLARPAARARCRSRRRTVAVARWAGVGALAVATGPTLGALLVTAGGWRWVFYVNLPIGAAAWLAGRAVLPRTDPDAHEPSRPGLPGRRHSPAARSARSCSGSPRARRGVERAPHHRVPGGGRRGRRRLRAAVRAASRAGARPTPVPRRAPSRSRTPQ